MWTNTKNFFSYTWTNKGALAIASLVGWSEPKGYTALMWAIGLFNGG